MQRVLEMMRDAMVETWTVVGPWAIDLAARVPAWAWASLATLALGAAALRMLRPTRVEAGAAPEVLLTRGQATADGPASDRFHVEVAFSNLHYETVQLLRIAVVGSAGPPAVAEVPAIVPARRAVDLRTDVVLRPGGRGRLDLYLLVPSSPAMAWRIRVPLTWDPFTRRYTAVLLGQRARAVRRLPEPEAPLPPRRRSAPADTGRAPATPRRRRAPRADDARDAGPPGASAARPATDRPPAPAPSEPSEAPPSGPSDAALEEPAVEPPRTPRLRFPERF
jgi:hypothetical protein